ncbi:MAG: pyridoxamine 5'-phosphate oxidase [Actinobacteria bacterium]|jgi:general stress protein 26|uniref:Unannotated protein n=1 Tax=freshwater metagenome TaxID=449393 RepID=A0A6J7C055_9ZZZZ|nr:pyridoxamine 5'-phosphate oxidase [Actinomycetota bacterium]MSW77966.1 pyridoxamine 5'-phosphate oxidase [Actinomycetota bacterium]MSX55411.1 pyridoxamine 5'-phosphate oxidase [Actinomycetota bacterium]MSX92914.1 pyridoxamine 5'-phosphate oxidase [Actinomycetota bacterium]MSZ83278.1 pyridoxamine 5'-phosphate oxidase [Actinomycetota bacterium]
MSAAAESTEQSPPRKGVRLTSDEAWQRIEASHTGIITTLRRDGVPISLPVWFVTFDHQIFLSTPAGSKKVVRVRNDSRASFLIEGGERWAELTAVHLTGTISLLEDEQLFERIDAASHAKYASFRTSRSEMPSATRDHYANTKAYLRFVPDPRIVSWDNSRLFS